jgi:proteasome beta subunit
MTTAGTSGDNQSLIRVMKAQISLFNLESGNMTVNAAVTLFSNILSEKYQYTYLPFMIFNLVAGYDTAPRLYSVDPVGSSQEETKYSSTGSGMIVAYGILDRHWKKDMSVEEAIKLAVQSIVSARARISSVGGESIDVFVITKDGIQSLPKTKVEAIIKELK